MAELLAAITGRHPVVGGAEDRDRQHLRALWKQMVRKSTTVKRAPPPIEDEIDILFAAFFALAFVLAVC